jgi:ABC-type phosphate transport system permease subunit
MRIVVLLLLIVLIGSIWVFPAVAPALGITLLLFSLAMAISSIFKKHSQAENPRPKIAKDVLILVITLLLIIFLGGLAGMYANHYASPRFGTVVGFVSAIGASFAVGYLVNRGARKIIG